MENPVVQKLRHWSKCCIRLTLYVRRRLRGEVDNLDIHQTWSIRVSKEGHEFKFRNKLWETSLSSVISNPTLRQPVGCLLFSRRDLESKYSDPGLEKLLILIDEVYFFVEGLRRVQNKRCSFRMITNIGLKSMTPN